MFAQILQVGGFLATYLVVVLYYALGGRSAWFGAVTFVLTLHVLGDYLKLFLKRDDPIVLLGYNLSAMIQPVYFLLWVGISMQAIGAWLLFTGHLRWGSLFSSVGAALAGTGFVGSIIYKPQSDIRW